VIAIDPVTGEELVMPDTREDYEALKARLGQQPGACCNTFSPVQHWPLFAHCGGGNAPGKPIRPHCTCDACF
jgi:hypothetical protein